MPIPKLTLIGAGPGDPDLITLKGIKALQSAQVILYDALVDTRLLEYASADALKIFVGKRKGYKAYAQEEIHELILHYATHFGHVARLKGVILSYSAGDTKSSISPGNTASRWKSYRAYPVRLPCPNCNISP